MPTQYDNSIAAVTVAADGASAGRYYVGFSLRNTNATAVVVAIYDGTDTSGQLLESIALAAGESARELYPLPIDLVTGSVYVDTAAGVTGGVRVII